MTKYLILIAYGMILITQSQGQIYTCSCPQLITQADCKRFTTCQWNTSKKICQSFQQTTEQTGAQYCDQFKELQISCAEANPCSWNGSTCTYFTSCTIYLYDTDEKCQAVSKRCISNGVHCIEKGNCNSYTSQNSCIKDSNNKYCYWNNENISPICQLANYCSQLPKTLNSDSQCREQINECTASINGGCIVSGVKCEDQISQISCASNKDQTQVCFWDEGKCKDKICDNASLTLVTDQACKDFLPTCTTKQGGGCITRSNCSVAIQSACVTDNDGNDCFWNGQRCVNKTCINGLQQYITNTSCQQYLRTCITNGNGCVDNTGCEAATISDACEMTLDGQQCHWDGNACKLKSCENAGQNYVGHDQCTQYMDVCTGKDVSGCQTRTCDNAPLSNNTNDLCNSYLINGNCITKMNGGCKTNTTCENIDIEIACIKDKNGQVCFWSNEKCLPKICSNAPLSNNTDQLCKDFLDTCTIDSNNKCVEKTCENIQQEENCTNDLNSKPCLFKGKCYKKYCSLASKDISNHEDCQKYLKTCTLDNSGYGCMNIPLVCSGISNIDGCVIRQDGNGCAWQGNNCIDRTCLLADETYQTTLQCNKYKSECVVNNTLSGCIQLPIKCSDRKQKENCEVEQKGDAHKPKCQWDDKSDISNPVCIDIKCENAHLVSLKDDVTLDGCIDYFGLNCVKTIINEIPQCMQRPNNCNGLIQETCSSPQILIGDLNCYWDDVVKSCKSYLCSNITFANDATINYQACNNLINICTVNSDEPPTGCSNIKQCNTYSTSDQCSIDQNGQKCFWDGNICMDMPCQKADDSDQYQSQDSCQLFSNKCVLNQSKCSLKKTNCNEYKNQNACAMHTIDKKQQCAWIVNKCQNTSAEFDCTQVTGEGLTFVYCQSINSLCSVNAQGTSCIKAETECSNYSQENCKTNSSQIKCVFFDSKCQIDCTAAPQPRILNSCNNFSPICALSVDGSKCINKTDTCTNTVLENCTESLAGFCYVYQQKCIIANSRLLSDVQCDTIKQQYITLQQCSKISQGSSTCVANSSNTSCTNWMSYCSDYDSQIKCAYSKFDGDCFWSEVKQKCLKWQLGSCSEYFGASLSECKSKNKSCSWISGTTCANNCSNLPGPYDLQNCNQYNQNCIAKLDGTGCVDWVDTCANTNKQNCLSAQEGYCYLNGETCKYIKPTPLPFDQCETILGTNLNAKYCQGISLLRCSVNALQNKCIQSQDYCQGYSSKLENCFYSFYEKYCVINSDGTQCAAFTQQSSCSDIKIYGLNNYTDYHCNQFKSSCIAKQDKTGCEENIKCLDFGGSNLTYYQCQNYSLKCSVNAAQNQCVDAKNTCSEYSVTNCRYALIEGECIVSNNICIQNSCFVTSPITNMNDCQSYSQNCVLRVGGCQEKGSCDSYKVKEFCLINNENENCLWNPNANECVKSSCDAAEASDAFDTHQECQTAGFCTVKVNDEKTVGLGCIPLAACDTYIIQEQCEVDDKNVECVWNKNDSQNQFCAYKSCATAPLEIQNHHDCFQYLEGCTVNLIDINATLTSEGCTPLKKCNEYLKEQCYKSVEKDENDQYIECAWNGQICDNKNCLTADDTFNTPTLCSEYFQGCTVNKQNDGCIEIPETCEQMTEEQCYKDSLDRSNRKCMWIQEQFQCVTKTCENSPNYENETECNNHLEGCTTDSKKCKTKICEDFPFITDDECKQVLIQGQCTSNGMACVTRSSCAQVQSQEGCTFDIEGKLCQWMTFGYCTLRNCSTAPVSLITEEQCKQYYSPTNKTTCTTKKDGGCTTKGQCISANIETACTTDYNGVDCQWDVDKCRLKECKDYQGISHNECNKIKTTCTVGMNGKCAQIQNCENITIQEACIIGNNGPCLWIDKYVNNDGTFGACFLYESCKSFNWKTHNQCQLISSNCTTNGNNCIGITNCNETNVNGGCHVGTDGSCIQTVLNKGSTDLICKKYSNCESAYYLTHDECNQANPNCTSDYKNGCISLDSCSNYSLQAQCHINKDGQVKDKTGTITSTGNCIWDSINNTCRDEQCKDIILTTEEQCSDRLNQCTTDGISCINKQQCDQYKNEITCNFAKSKDGNVCFWVEATDQVKASCRIKICTDIQNGYSNEICSKVSNCVTDGINCVNSTVCSEYTTKIGCMQKGSNGPCFWTESIGKCAVITSCKFGNDEFTCNQINDRCQWNSKTQQCSAHTCESYQKVINKCSYYPSWDYSTYNICILRDGICISTNPQTLQEDDCLIGSAYQYSWNPSTSKCTQCATLNQINDSNTNKNNASTMQALKIIEKVIFLVFLFEF